MILIGSQDLKNFIKDDPSIKFINEDKFVTENQMEKFLLKMRGTELKKRRRWYKQQFIKMGYARICRKEYYLIFDGDTFPIKNFNMFKNDHPIFDMYNFFYKPFIESMDRLIPGLKYSKSKSYVTEHMIIRTKFMKNLLDDIEMNSNIPGKLFWQKIFMSVDDKNLPKNGFSEYFVYGAYVDTKYPKFYHHRDFLSLRGAEIFYGTPENLDENDINWLSQYYHALTFEDWHHFDEKYLPVVKEPIIRKLYKPEKFFANAENIEKNLKNIIKNNTNNSIGII